MNTLTRIIGIIILDTSAAVGGACALWHSGGTTATTGSVMIQFVLALALIAALTLRHVLVGRTTVLERDVRAITIELPVAIAHIVLIIGAAISWGVSGQYYWGWQLTFAAIFLVVTVVLQLLADVTTGRNRSPADRPEQQILERFFTLETWRLISLTAAVATLALAHSIHRWDPGMVNFLILFDAAVIGVTLALRLLLTARKQTENTSRSAQDSTP
ncbi:MULTISPECIES: hypothetical protein [unclassified Curtobacterium]|uniref:hypothetical protein n=1 Tax=unclassified Curtobacterium TaxID=257496 RepID=UPI001358D731|nr:MULTISPECIES: hypothetical protein [unclassified Curtobacterium]MBF4588385.1 hypothetical protein [Curtobacterium sp. VKM Ac-2887]